MSMEKWMAYAKEVGFSEVVSVRIDTLKSRKEIREMCAADKCHAYGKNWTCPPYCGTIEECQARLGQYEKGMLLQTVGKLQKAIDTKGYREIEERHLKNFMKVSEAVKKEYPEALCLGSGGCRICSRCAWPDPCRFPEKACSSMEAYGLFVTQICRDNGLKYYYGEKTMAYCACILV